MTPINTAAMSATPLRQPAPADAEPVVRTTVEDLVGRIADLVLQRQSLRSAGATPSSLEQNRRALVSAHWELSHALIDRHCPKRDAA
jgi:hypothetical protein